MLIVTVCGSVLQQVWRVTADSLTKALLPLLLLCSQYGVSQLQNRVGRNS